jgi:hypothetical protein
MVDVPRLAGQAVAVPLAALARRRSDKPMHPDGAVLDGVLERTGARPPIGVPWLDEPGRDDVVVRLSRGVGLPSALPDLLGLAVRIPGDGRPVDVLLSTTGVGKVGRWVPVPRRDAAVPYTSIMGYRSDAGTVRLAALPAPRRLSADPERQAAEVTRRPVAFRMAAAVGGGGWQAFARLELTEPVRPLDPDIRFDAVLHPPPGLVADGPLARFRRPAYASARAARS